MAHSSAAEIFSTLKSYAQKLSDGERSPAEVASALNDWARESADSVKARIHDEVEAAVEKMGFVKREEFEELAASIAELKRSATKKPTTERSKAKKSVAKKSVVKKTVKKKVNK